MCFRCPRSYDLRHCFVVLIIPWSITTDHRKAPESYPSYFWDLLIYYYIIYFSFLSIIFQSLSHCQLFNILRQRWNAEFTRYDKPSSDVNRRPVENRNLSSIDDLYNKKQNRSTHYSKLDSKQDLISKPNNSRDVARTHS